MRRIGTILAGGNGQIHQIMKIRNCWIKIVGEVLSAHTEPVVIRKKALEVMCDSPAWAQQIGMLTKVIEKQVKEITGIRVQKVESKFGVVRKTPQKVKASSSVRRPDIDPEDVKRLKDPKLADAVRALIDRVGSSDD